MICDTGEARKGCRQIHAMSTARATWAQWRGNGQGTGRAGIIQGRNLADCGSPRRKVAERGRRAWPDFAWSETAFADAYGRPQQDSNLRTRLRSAMPKKALTCANLAFPMI
jgi:hypothetical protein